jgi:hypothetical protein
MAPGPTSRKPLRQFRAGTTVFFASSTDTGFPVCRLWFAISRTFSAATYCRIWS